LLMVLNGWQNTINSISNFPNKKVIASDPVFHSILDYSFYKEIVDFFGFDDNYQIAQEVHSMYYACRQRSARDFYQYFTSQDFYNWLERIKLL
jgi:hypothetical protein